MNPQSNLVFLYSHELEQTIMAPPLTEDDAFNSHPLLGTIAYRIPGLDTLFGYPMSYFSGYSEMLFTLSIQYNDENGLQNLACGDQSRCQIKYKRIYSPRLYYIKPPIIYYESMVEVVFDPRSTQDLITDLQDGEMPFINVNIGPTRLDFEFNVNDENTFLKYDRNLIRG